MDARQLRYFVAIYENRALARAAREVRVAVSALSHHLANLETHLGSALFIRQAKGLEPTAAGERLYAHARTILKAFDTAERDIRDSSTEIAGKVSVGMAHSAVKAIGAEIFQRATAYYPRLRLSLSESLSGPMLLHLLASEVDLALVYNPPDDARLATIPVLDEQLFCVGRAEFLGDTDAPIAFADILDLPIIILHQGLSARALLDNATLLKRLEAAARFEMNSVHAISGSLVAGLGCTIGTRHFFSDQIARGEIRARPIAEPTLHRRLYLCKMADQPASFAREAVERLLLELVGDAVRSGNWEAELV